jgi:hypothetical protein
MDQGGRNAIVSTPHTPSAQHKAQRTSFGRSLCPLTGEFCSDSERQELARSAIRVEWGTLAFDQSGVSGLNDVGLMQISESRDVLLLPLQSHPRDVQTESTRNAVLFGLHRPFRHTDP